MSNNYISVVIPTCDRPIYLLEAIKSVIKQTWGPKEILIIDNGQQPVDITKLPVSNSIRLIRALPRFGVSQARNLGVILAKGDYVAFLDDDDSWDHEYLQSVYDTISNTGADIILGRLCKYNDNEPIIGKQAVFKNREDLIRKILYRNPGVVGSNTTVSRTAFIKTAGYDPWITTNQDKALVLDMLLKEAIVERANQAWVNFRDDGVGSRQTELKKRIKGKFRFTQKYWAKMTWHMRLFNFMQLIRLWIGDLWGRTR